MTCAHGFRSMPETCSSCLGIQPTISKKLDALPYEDLITDKICDWYEPSTTTDERLRSERSKRGAMKRHSKPKTRWQEAAPPDHISVPAYAAATKRSANSVRNSIKAGTIQAITVDGRRWIPKSAVPS